LNFQTIIPDKSIALFVKNIWVFENETNGIQTSLPFFADGFPGLMLQQSESGLVVNPHSKTMPQIFLYGQTIRPIELEVSGKYLIIIFQLYPFVLRSFFNVNPESINDNCFYFEDSDENIGRLKHQLSLCKTIDEKIGSISELLLTYFEWKKQQLDFEIRRAIECMIATKGQQSIRSIVEDINLNIRTFERRFKIETGLSPKQFAQIIQFQASLMQLTIRDYTKLTDIVYQNGFSDQSHFIKVFKAFTGKTPKTFTR
jgi:AraC-like DNA-binding protein